MNTYYIRKHRYENNTIVERYIVLNKYISFGERQNETETDDLVMPAEFQPNGIDELVMYDHFTQEGELLDANGQIVEPRVYV